MWITWFRRVFHPSGYKSRLPVICVGNLHSGGTGKTPVVIAIADHYSDQSPAIVSRGYKSRAMRQGAKLDRNHASGVAEYGDEPWMLSSLSACAIFVGGNRRKSFRAIEKEGGHSLILMDDGFQNLGVKKDVSFICIPTSHDPKESFCLPAGELREGFSSLNDAEGVLLPVGSFFDEWESFLSTEWPRLPRFRLSYQVQGFFEGDKPILESDGTKWGVFCGIGNPERFLHKVQALPHTILKCFPDHHSYTKADVEALISEGHHQGVTAFLTTDKDWYKVASYFREQRKQVCSLRLSAKLPEEFWMLTDQAVRRSS
jgi:tetraacyldisaccharide 4'-kinase